jgi:hypothetical protein
MDFIGPLPKTLAGYDSIMTIVDSASKRVITIPNRTTDTAADIANLFELHVWRHHGLPRKIISDRDSRFISRFWTSLMKSLNIKQNVATAYHPQTDGQTEIKNDWIISALRNFVHYYQMDWDTKLHIVEYGINDTMTSSTGYTPFYLDTGQHPTSILDISLTPFDSLDLRDLQAAYQVAKLRISEAQDKQAAQANKKRIHSPFQIGDLVLISMEHYRPPHLRLQPSTKLSEQYTGPYRIIDLVGPVPSCKLEIPNNWDIHPVFHPEKLKMYYYDHNGPHPLDSLPIGERLIEKILAIRKIDNRYQVLIKWKNHNPIFNCWLDLDSQLRARIRQDIPDIDSQRSIVPRNASILQGGVTESSS